jgi:hypothetical protein
VSEALSRPDDLSTEDVERLRHLHDDIERLLERTAEADPAVHVQVKQGAETLIERLERTHPTLTSVLGSLADALTRMGI